MKIINAALAGLATAALLPAKAAYAMCPLCTAAAVGGLGLAERYGVDDTISGLWVGALTVSMIAWTNDFLEKRKWAFRFYKPIVFASYYALVLIPLQVKGYLFAGKGTFLGVDKLFFGIVLGSILFAIGGATYSAYKAKHGKALFPFQKVVQPLALVAIATAVFYFITA
jgi:hypothetical protein